MSSTAVLPSVQLVDVPVSAAMDTLLAIEGFAERLYADRAADPDQQRRYNALASVVLPLREALDRRA